MKKVISCEFNMDSGCVEVRYSDGSLIAINCTAVERQVAENRFERSELDWLVYHALIDYVNLLLYGDMREYLSNITDFYLLDI